jgi:uncharacterized protein (TIGR03437 family)
MHYRRIVLGLGICLAAFAQQREKEPDDKQAQREEWFYGQRAYPYGRIPSGARIKAIEEIRAIDRAARLRHAAGRTTSRAATTLDSTTWTSIGPRPTDVGSTYVTAGRVNAVAIDPRDSNVVYVGAAEGGVWKTTNGGADWKPLTDDQASLAMGALAIDPANPDTIYAGTGEENFSQDSYYGAGFLKSTDGGATWSNLVGPFLRDKIAAISIHPTNSQILLCTSLNGVWRSTDGAANWTRVLSGIGTSVVFDPTNGNIAYTALGDINGSSANGAYKSTDGGQTWQAISGSGANALPRSNVGRVAIAIAASTPTTLYAAIHNASSDALLGIYKTTDSGATWNSTGAPNLCPGAAAQCWYDMTIHVSPKDADVVFAAGSLVIVRSLDGGGTWSSLNLTGPNRVEMHVDFHNMAFTGDASKLYVVNDGGVYSTSDITRAQVNWAQLNDTLAITQFYPGLSIHPTDPNITLAGAQDNGTQRYSGNASWSDVTCGDGGYTAIDPAAPSISYGACQLVDVRRTANNASSFSRNIYGLNGNDRLAFIAPLTIDPVEPLTLYFGTYRLWQSRDGAGKWSAISPDLTSGGSSANIRAIAVAPSNDNWVYVGSSNVGRISTSASNTRIYVTNNARDGIGATWNNRSNGLPPRAITQIAVDPIDSATAYATFSGFPASSAVQGHVYKTTDGGNSWSDASGNLPNIPVNDIVIDPDRIDTLYIATDAGVMVSTDAGASWSSLGSGLPRVVVHGLALHRPSRTLRAATHGRSAWDILVPVGSDSLQPTISALAPTTANAGGGDFTLSATGTNFAAGTVLRWNGRSRPTNVVDNTHLTAQIAAGDIAQVGRATIDAFNPSRGRGASNPTNFNVGPAPVSSAGAFVSAANPAGGNALAPGSIGTLYGANFAGGISVSDAPPLPTFLGGTSLTMAGTVVPLFFVAPGQINFQVPWFTVTGSPSVPLVITQGLLSTTITVTLTSFSPALFTTNQSGTGQASARIASDGSIVAPTGAFPGSRPANKGEFVSLYCTGLGNVRNRPNTGAASPSNPFADTLTTPIVTVGNVPATVSFSGLAPGFVGLYQVNIKIPDNAPSGDAVPVSLSIGGVNSNTVTIAVQ